VCKPQVAVLVFGLLFPASFVLPAWAQSNSVQPAAAAADLNPIGKIVTSTGSVTIERTNAVLVQAKFSGDGAIGQVKVGDSVYKGDVIQTGADGKVGITFTDETAFNVASNARIVLNELVYDPNGKSNSLLFSLTKGAFTFIAGKVAKSGNMQIDTPVATMGIRGTAPRVEIRDDGSVAFTTLIEDNGRKTAPANGRAAPIRQRDTKNSSPTSGSATQQSENNLDKSIKINMKICRGC